MAYGALGELLEDEDTKEEVLVINLLHKSAPEWGRYKIRKDIMTKEEMKDWVKEHYEENHPIMVEYRDCWMMWEEEEENITKIWDEEYGKVI